MIPKKVRDFARKRFGRKKLEWVAEPKPGFKNMVYFVKAGRKKYVVKSSLLGDQGFEKRAEHAILKLLKAGPVPESRGYSPRDNISIKSFMFGKHKTNLSIAEIREAGRGLALLHSGDFRKPGKPFTKRKPSNYKQYLKQQIKFMKGNMSDLHKRPSARKVMREIESLLSKALVGEKVGIAKFKGNRFSVINFDLIPKNVLWKGGKPFVIDWGDASIGDPAMEMSKIFYTWDFSRSQKKAFLDSYGGLTKAFSQRMKVYDRFVRINGLVFEANMYYWLKTGAIKPIGEVNMDTFRPRFASRYVRYLRDYHSTRISNNTAERVLDAELGRSKHKK